MILLPVETANSEDVSNADSEGPQESVSGYFKSQVLVTSSMRHVTSGADMRQKNECFVKILEHGSG